MTGLAKTSIAPQPEGARAAEKAQTRQQGDGARRTGRRPHAAVATPRCDPIDQQPQARRPADPSAPKRPEGGAEGCLEIHRSCASTPTGSHRGKGRFNYDDLQVFKDLQKNGYKVVGTRQSVKTCGTVPIIKDSAALGVTTQGNLQVCGMHRCGSRWCPDCWSKIATQRQGDVQRVAEWAVGEGHQLVLATLTASHVTNSTLAECGGDMYQAVLQQDVTELLDHLGKAYRTMTSGRGGMALRQGRIGYIRAFELTVDGLDSRAITGVHGHFHVLLILDRNEDLKEYSKNLFKRWKHCCDRYDLHVSKEAYDFKRLNDEDPRRLRRSVAYLTKGEKHDAEDGADEAVDADRIAIEVTRGDGKQARRGARVSPEGLLRSIGSLSDQDWKKYGPRACAQWRAIEEACRGRRWLTWSKGLREQAGIGVEMTDEEIANASVQVKDEKVSVVHYPSVKDHLGELRKLVGKTQGVNLPKLVEFLDQLGVPHVEVPQWRWDECVRHNVELNWALGVDEVRRHIMPIVGSPRINL